MSNALERLFSIKRIGNPLNIFFTHINLSTPLSTMVYTSDAYCKSMFMVTLYVSSVAFQWHPTRIKLFCWTPSINMSFKISVDVMILLCISSSFVTVPTNVFPKFLFLTVMCSVPSLSFSVARLTECCSII